MHLTVRYRNPRRLDGRRVSADAAGGCRWTPPTHGEKRLQIVVSAASMRLRPDHRAKYGGTQRVRRRSCPARRPQQPSAPAVAAPALGARPPQRRRWRRAQRPLRRLRPEVTPRSAATTCIRRSRPRPRPPSPEGRADSLAQLGAMCLLGVCDWKRVHRWRASLGSDQGRSTAASVMMPLLAGARGTAQRESAGARAGGRSAGRARAGAQRVHAHAGGARMRARAHGGQDGPAALGGKRAHYDLLGAFKALRWRGRLGRS